jgi:pimeloyl-ACP methyl ester carboxylesterase
MRAAAKGPLVASLGPMAEGRRSVVVKGAGLVSLEVDDSGGLARPGADASAGAGARAIVLAHGLTATRRYVVHGSRLLERAGYRVVAYDARGHGRSSAPPDPSAYTYDDLVSDLTSVMDALEIERAILVGASMGAATVLAYTLRCPERVEALVQITPAYAGGGPDFDRVAEMDELADALERDGVLGFLRALGEPPVAPRFRGLVREAVRQRIERHEDLRAVAAALRIVPRSQPFEGVEALERVSVPTLVVASRDEADPDHPYAVAQLYAERIPGAEFISEAAGESPLAWRGGRLSRAILAFLETHGLEP